MTELEGEVQLLGEGREKGGEEGWSAVK